ncbi:hypothetical protein Tco_0414688 [Tanacetum coccineum]
MVLAYKTSLESVEEKLEVYKANESIYLQDIKELKFEIHLGEIDIREIKKKLEIVQKEKDGIQLNVDKFEHASKIPPPYTGKSMPPTPDLSFTGLDEFVNEPIVKNYKAMSSGEEPKVIRKNDDAPIIKEWVSDDEKEDVSQPKTEKKIVRPSIVKKEFGNPQMDLQYQGVIDSGCSRHMTGNLSYLTNYEEIDRGYVAFGGNPKGGKITGKGTIKTGNLDFENVYFMSELAFVKAKSVNREVQLQALVDEKKIIITKSIVRRYLQLEDAEGVDCLPNPTIFEQLTLMGLLHGMSLVVLWHLQSSV